MELVEVEMVGAEPPQTRLQCPPDERPVPALRPLSLGVLLASLGEHVSELARQLDPVPMRTEHATDELLVCALTVGVARLEEGDAEVERLEQQALAGLL